MGGFAWVTLATNDSYSLGALVLANSLRQVGTQHQIAVLVTPGVTNAMKEKLSSVFNVVQEVNILDSKDEANLRLLKRPELGVTFTKLHCWRLTQFDKCVFLDADTLVLQNCDELFDREELSAAPDVGWPDCFNSGVFVYRPSNDTYESLVQFALDRGSFDGGDQGLLNLYFSDWSSKDINKHLPFIYNLCSTACYSYLPAFKQFGGDAKIVHFIGASKPWLQYFNTETRKVQPTFDLKHLEGVLQHWWNIFCSLIHPNLSPDMARSRSDVTHTRISSRTPPQTHDTPKPDSTKTVPWDPWEEYHQKQTQTRSVIPDQTPQAQTTYTVSVSPETHTFVPTQTHTSFTPYQVNEPSQIKPVESHNTNADIIASREQVPPAVPTHFHESSRETNVSHYHQPAPVPVSTVPPYIPPTPVNSSQDSPVQVERVRPVTPPNSSQDVQTQVEIQCPPKPSQSVPVPTNECEAAASVCTETTLHTSPREEECDAGLAGAFAQLTLGAPRTAEQSALDDHLRRQGWEVGNIDYLGRDSFENIWSKICATLSAGAPTSPPATTEATPSPIDAPVQKTTTEASVTLPQQEVPPTVPIQATPQETTQSVPETEQSIPLAEQAQELETPAPVESSQPPITTQPQQTEVLACPIAPQTQPIDPAPTPLPVQPSEVPPSQEAAPQESTPTAPSQEPTEVQTEAVVPASVTPEAATAAKTETPQEPAAVAAAEILTDAAPQDPTVPEPLQAVEPVSTPEPAALVSAPESAAPLVEASPPAVIPVAEAVEPTPAPIAEVAPTTPVPATEAAIPTPAPVTEAVAPAAETVAPAPATEAVAPVPATEAVAPVTAAEAVAPVPATEAVAPVPAVEAVAPVPATEAVAPVPAVEAVAPAPATEAVAPVPATKTVAPVPATEAVAPVPATEAVAPTPAVEVATLAPTAEAAAPAPTTGATPAPAEVAPPAVPQEAPSSPAPASPTAEATAAQVAPAPEKTKSKSGSEQAKVKPEAAQSGAASTASPTPPPRKASGGVKKTKAKK